jgi:hypothetical protein
LSLCRFYRDEYANEIVNVNDVNNYFPGASDHTQYQDCLSKCDDDVK